MVDGCVEEKIFSQRRKSSSNLPHSSSLPEFSVNPKEINPVMRKMRKTKKKRRKKKRKKKKDDFCGFMRHRKTDYYCGS